MRKGWAAVILQRTKQRIGIDLIAWASQITAAVIAARLYPIEVTVPPLLKMFAPSAPAFRIVLEISTTLCPRRYKCPRQNLPSAR